MARLGPEELVWHHAQTLAAAWRRAGWIMDGRVSAAKLANLALAGSEFARGADRLRAWPAVLKVDLSPLCNLRCVSCRWLWAI